jgi:hypothetical protein
MLIFILVIVDTAYKTNAILFPISKLSEFVFTGSCSLALLCAIYEIVVCWMENDVPLCIYVYTEKHIYGCSVT